MKLYIVDVFSTTRYLVNQRVMMLLLLTFFTAAARSPTDDAFFAGAAVAVHVRRGEVTLHNKKTIPVTCQPLTAFELVYGKNVALPHGLRLSVPLVAEYGEVRERILQNVQLRMSGVDSIITSNINLYTMLLTVGIRPRLEYPVRLTDKLFVIPGAGAGFHYVAFSNEGRKRLTVRGKTINALLTEKEDPFFESAQRLSFSGIAGCGIEIRLMQRVFCTLSYYCMIWKPIDRTTSSDLYIVTPQPYAENFISHTTQITVSLFR